MTKVCNLRDHVRWEATSNDGVKVVVAGTVLAITRILDSEGNEQTQHYIDTSQGGRMTVGTPLWRLIAVNMFPVERIENES